MIFDRSSLNQLFRYCLALCGERDQAYDLAQDAMEKYLTTDTQKVNNHYAFIKRIARNRFIDIQRRKQRLEFDVLEDIEGLSDIERELEALVVDELTLKSLWKSLTSSEREVVFLWAVEGMSAAEIASELDMPRATVLTRLRRMRLRLNSQNDSTSLGGG